MRLVWTASVIPDCLIAIVAEDLENVWEIIVDRPLDHATALSNLSTMQITPAVFVVKSKKLKSRFPTTLTFATIVRNDNLSALPVPLTLVIIPAVAAFLSPLTHFLSVSLPTMGTL